MLRRTFRAMGTDIELLLDAEPGSRAEGAFDRAETEFERLEQTMSRFRDDSELSRLNRDGIITDASRDLVRVVALALEARETTGGRFDPTVHDAVVAAGYDRTFDAVRSRTFDESRARSQPPCGGRVLVKGSTIELQPGFRPRSRRDRQRIRGRPGRRAPRGRRALPRQRRRRHRHPRREAGPWASRTRSRSSSPRAASQPPDATAVVGADNGEERHHLIDPATGLPAADAPVRVTVVAGSAAAAEVAAKAVFLGGEIDLPHVVVTTDGCTVLAGGLA